MMIGESYKIKRIERDLKEKKIDKRVRIGMIGIKNLRKDGALMIKLQQYQG